MALPIIEVETDGVANGGDAVAREDSGRVVFVDGALRGERVRVQLTTAKKKFAKGEVVEVLAPSPDRIEPPCPVCLAGCGGCSYMFASHAEQLEAKRLMVADAFERIARIAVPPVRHAAPLPTSGFRTTARVGVSGGVAGFRRKRSHDLVDVPDCYVAHPLLNELLDADFGGASGATLRVGANTGDRLVVLDGSDAGTSFPSDVQVITATELDEVDAFIHEEIGGHRFRISAGSFFQTRPDGADQLVNVVGDMVSAGRDVGALVDLCGGVGLFGVTIPATSLVTVEVNRAAHADAIANLSGVKQEIECVRSDIVRWRPSPADTVVADPPRDGLGADGVAAVAATDAEVVALVSCDVGAGGRDAGLLSTAGFECTEVVLVDLFPHTPRVEFASRWVRR